MKIGFVVFDGMTGLDLVGVHDPVTRLARQKLVRDLTWAVHALVPQVQDAAGLRIVVDAMARRT